MPWQNNQVIRLHSKQFGLGDNRYPCPWGIRSEPVRVHVANIRNIFLRQAAVLQQDVSLGGSAERGHGFPCDSSAFDKLKQITLRPSRPLCKSLVRCECVQTHFALAVKDLLY